MSNEARTPYAMIGSKQLTSQVFKTGDEWSGFKYRFNVFHVNSRTGKVSNWYGPEDIEAIVSLARVLAAELANDGCMDQGLRHRLRTISAALDETIAQINSVPSGDTDQ